jgi:hypothetical protein
MCCSMQSCHKSPDLPGNKAAELKGPAGRQGWGVFGDGDRRGCGGSSAGFSAKMPEKLEDTVRGWTCSVAKVADTPLRTC